eukprot:7147026-Ditylum_brightwellii.AAC.1
MDHDFCKANFTASAMLICQSPLDPNSSFREGQVTFPIKDKVTQPSNAISHAVEFINMIEQDIAKDDVVLDAKQILKKVPEATSKPY